jgi:RND family efflux transporter MFP subunit
MKRTNWMWLVAAVAAGLVGCGSSHQEKKQAAEPPGPAVAVKLAQVKQTEWPAFYDAVGTVRAVASGQVSGRVMAHVREVRVNVGDRVRAGQTLVVLDGRDLDVRQRQAEAASLEATTAAGEADHAIAAAKAQVELAEVTHRRMKDLFDKKSISNQEFDESAARVRMARASLEMAQSKRKQVDARIAQTVEETRGAVIMTGYTTITAPFGGVVTEKSVEPGNLAVPGAPLLTIEREGSYRLEASVEEASLGKVRLGQRVVVTIDSLDHTIDGTVAEIVPAIDPGTRAFIAKINLPATANIRSGMFGRARFVIGSRKTIVVPESAVAERGQMQWVFVPADGRARGRIVTLGQRNGSELEVLSGLAPGERIVAPVPPELADGSRLEVRQ